MAEIRPDLGRMGEHAATPEPARFEAAWLAARRRFDERALDPEIVRLIRAWGAALPTGCRPVVVDLGSGTGAGLERAARWLAPRPLAGYAVDRDPALLRLSRAAGRADRPPGAPGPATPVLADVLEPLAARGGPADGTVDLVVGHALADLLPLDRLAARLAALARPGGLVHLALVYDGLTAFAPVADPALDAALLAAFHRQMDRAGAGVPTYGGSTAGRRVGVALAGAGLTVLRDAPSVWEVDARDAPDGPLVLARLLRYVGEAARQDGTVDEGDIAGWEQQRCAALGEGVLRARVAHRDVLARQADV